MYRLTFTHSRPDWTNAVELKFSVRKGKVAWDYDLLAMAGSLITVVGKPRVATVRGGVSMHTFQHGFILGMRRYNVTELPIDNDLADALEQAAAVDDAVNAMIQDDAENNGISMEDLAGCLPDDTAQGSDMRNLAAAASRQGDEEDEEDEGEAVVAGAAAAAAVGTGAGAADKLAADGVSVSCSAYSRQHMVGKTVVLLAPPRQLP